MIFKNILKTKKKKRISSLKKKKKKYVEVSLEIDIDGTKVVIDRGLKRNVKSINQDFAAITINDIRFESSVTEVKQKIIEDTEVRLDVLRHVFGIDKYKRIQDNAQRIIMWIREESRTLQIESALLDVKRNELDSNFKFIKILESKTSIKEEEIKQSKISREIQQKEVDSLIQLVTEKENFKKEIEKSMIMHSNKQEQISRILKDIKEIDDSIGSIKIQPKYVPINIILEQISKIKKTIELLDKEYLDLNSKNNSLDILKNQELSKKSR